MNYLDTQLQVIQGEELTEFDPLTGTLAIGTGYLVGSLAFFFLLVGSMINSLKTDKPLTDKINAILNSGNRWVVHRFPDKSPNAFALGMGRHVFVTDGLIKLLSERELEAVLLHEVHHNKNKDTYKQLAYKHSFFYLIAFLALSTNSFPLAILVFLLLTRVNDIAHARLLGRRAEAKADRHAVEHGYAKDLISALEKIDNFVKQQMRKKPCGKICQIERKLSEMIDEHPTTKKRVELILRQADKLTKLKTFKRIKNTLVRIMK